jgi:hypothetical protein
VIQRGLSSNVCTLWLQWTFVFNKKCFILTKSSSKWLKQKGPISITVLIPLSVLQRESEQSQWCLALYVLPGSSIRLSLSWHFMWTTQLCTSTSYASLVSYCRAELGNGEYCFKKNENWHKHLFFGVVFTSNTQIQITIFIHSRLLIYKKNWLQEWLILELFSDSFPATYSRRLRWNRIMTSKKPREGIRCENHRWI